MTRLTYHQFATKLGLIPKDDRKDRFTYKDGDVEHHEKPKEDRSDRFIYKDGDVEHHPKKIDEKTFYEPEDHHSFGNSTDHQNKEHLDQFRAHAAPIEKAGATRDRYTAKKGSKLESIHHYKASGYMPINKHLRGVSNYSKDDPDYHKEILKHIKNLDHVTSHKTTVPMHVFRGIPASKSGFHKMKPGDSFTDHGFTSTTHKRSIADNFTGSNEDGYHVMKIHLPKGTRAHHFDAHRNTNDQEGEVVLHRGTKFHVSHHSHDPHTNTHYIHVTAESRKVEGEEGHEPEFNFGKSRHKAQPKTADELHAAKEKKAVKDYKGFMKSGYKK
jgi:hypothetical protein